MSAETQPKLPGSVLFMCSLNAVRSPMAAALMRHLHGSRVFVDSCGIRPEPEPVADPFVVQVLAELGIDAGEHVPKALDEMEGASGFDVIITLSPEAHHHALELTRTSAVEVEYWPTFDPTAVMGSREQRLSAYRVMRDDLLKRLQARFPATAANPARA